MITRPNPPFPLRYKILIWIDNYGNKVSFTTNAVTVTPASGSAQNFTLQDTSVVNDINQTTLYFGSSQTTDFIVFRDNTISSVSLAGVQTTLGWKIDDGSGGTTNDPNGGGGQTDDPDAYKYYLDPALVGKWQSDAGDKIEFIVYDTVKYKNLEYDIAASTGNSNNHGGTYIYTQNNGIYYPTSSILFLNYTITNDVLTLTSVGRYSPWVDLPGSLELRKASFSW